MCLLVLVGGGSCFSWSNLKLPSRALSGALRRGASYASRALGYVILCRRVVVCCLFLLLWLFSFQYFYCPGYSLPSRVMRRVTHPAQVTAEAPLASAPKSSELFRSRLSALTAHLRRCIFKNGGIFAWVCLFVGLLFVLLLPPRSVPQVRVDTLKMHRCAVVCCCRAVVGDTILLCYSSGYLF